MAEVELDDVTKIFPGPVEAVRDMTLTVRDEEFIVLVGPSGCGKSTTLRMIAGLEEVTSGTIRIGDRVVNDVPPKDRDIAMVFQNYALYPHMTVFRNMAFGLKLRKIPKTEITQRVDPEAFLFDEPLSNLDAKLRVETRAELKSLHRRLHTTTIYVTHDQEEAMTLGDRIVVMHEGLVHQVDTPLEVYERPVNRFVAGFVGTPPMNFLSGTLARSDGRLYWESGAGKIAMSDAQADALAGHVGRDVVMGVRPEALSSTAAGRFAGTDNAIPVTVNVVEVLGDKMDVHMSAGDDTALVARVDAHERLKERQQEKMYMDIERAHFFEPGDAGENLCLGGVSAGVQT